jgi:hypothetical protein
MYKTYDEIEEEIGKQPLLDRLKTCLDTVCDITSERRTTKISIPPMPYDEDLFMVKTIRDAIEALEGEIVNDSLRWQD